MTTLKKTYYSILILLGIAGIGLGAAGFMKRYGEQGLAPEVIQLQDPTTPAKAEGLPELYPVTPFALTDQNGAPFNSDALKGKVWLAYLFFSTCPGQCPMMTANMRKVSTFLEDEERVHIVSVSVDPETDTPEQMLKYAAQYQITNPRWHFLTGPLPDVEALAVKGFRLGSAESPQMHSEKFVLVDGDGMIRGYFSGITDAEVAAVPAAVNKLLQEQDAEEGQ